MPFLCSHIFLTFGIRLSQLAKRKRKSLYPSYWWSQVQTPTLAEDPRTIFSM